MVTTGNSSWRETGNTDFQNFRAAVRRSWQAGESPLASTDVAQAVFEALYPRRLTRLAAAQMWMETKNGSWNCSTAPQGMPCIPAINKNPFAMKSPGGGWRLYDSYVEAASEWADRILDPAGPYAKAKTIAEYTAIYAPPDADGGNPQIPYITTVCQEIDALPLVQQEKPPMPPNPYPMPVVYDLATDFRRYGLTRTQANKILQNRFENRQGYSIRALVCHIQEGTSSGSLKYWADTPGVQASSTVMIQKDGSVLKIIPPQHGPWTNGDVQNPSAKGQALIDRVGANPNLATLSIEAEGFSQDTPPEAQVTAICWQLTEWMNAYGLTAVDIYKHADINSVTRANCPGKYWDVVMQRLTGAAPSPAWPGKPNWLDADLIPLLFPEATPGGIRTNAWFEYAEFYGLAPARKAFVFQGTDEELILFEGGLMINKAGKWVGHA